MSALPPINLEEYEHTMTRQPFAVSGLLNIALQALSGRALVWAAFLGAVTLWTLAMLDPSTIKTVVAVGYCITTLGPILIRDSKG